MFFIKRKVKNQDQLHIPFGDSQDIGGSTTFMDNLKTYLDKKGLAYSTIPEQARVIFFPISFNKKILDKIKKRGGKIIQRLDGVYYPSKHGKKYISLNKNLKDVYLNYADLVIFQSKYSRFQCFLMLGKIKKEKYTIIINGVDKTIFYPKKQQLKLEKEGKIKFVTTGSFRNIDMLEPIIKALDLLKKELDFKLTIVGPIKNSILKKYLKRNCVCHIPLADKYKMAEILRKNHIFIYSHLNPPCPNSVIEAISCGLPIVGFDSGAMSELLFFSKDLLAFVSDDILQKYEDFDYQKLLKKILQAIRNYRFYKKRALAYGHLYSFEECGRKYLNIFKKFLNEV